MNRPCEKRSKSGLLPAYCGASMRKPISMWSKNFSLPHSPGVRAGGFIFLSGMVSIDPATGERAMGTVASETQQNLSNMAHILESAGSAMNKVVLFGRPTSAHDMWHAARGWAEGGDRVHRSRLGVRRVPTSRCAAQVRFRPNAGI